MEVRFVVPDLRKLDELDIDLLVTPIHAGERPLRGVSGLIDWRLCGRMSRLLTGGVLRGQSGELVLLATAGRFQFDRILVVGVGEYEEATARLALKDVFAALDGLRVRRVGMAMPGRALGQCRAESAMELLSAFVLEAHEQDALCVIDAAEEHRGMQRVLDSARRRARVAG